MWPSLLHLLKQAWQLSLTCMGTSALAVGAGLVLFLIKESLVWKRDGWGAVKKKWAGSAGIGLLLTVFLWVCLFAFCVADSVYQDHRNLVSAANKFNTRATQGDQTIAQLKQQLENAEHNKTEAVLSAKSECWIKNYAAPAISASWGIATVTCNTTIKPPYSIELDYDQSVLLGPFTFPVGSEFSKIAEFNQGTKAVAMVDLHTIIPDEPFSIMAQGSGGNFPLVKKATIRAKGVVFEFHP